MQTLTAPGAAEYFDAAQDIFENGARLNGSVSDFFSIAGKIVQIRSSPGAMQRHVSRALAHLATDAGEPDFTIYAWDSEDSGFGPLRPAWTLDAFGQHGLISGFNDDGFHTAIQTGPSIFRMVDTRRCRAIYWTPSAAGLPVWEKGAPLRPLLHEWLRSCDLLPVHGGAIGNRDGGVLLAGAGGTGKSNLSLSALASPLLYASDDFCVLSQSPAWTAHSLYSTGKLAAGDLHRHPYLQGLESNADSLDREKALFFLQEHFPEKLLRTMPLRAIVTPRIVRDEDSQLVPASTAAAQKAIATSTIELSPWTAAFTFSRVAALVRALPCYELRIGRRPKDALAQLERLLGRLGQAQSATANPTAGK